MNQEFTYKSFSNYWLDNVIHGHLSDSTHSSYKTKISKYITPYIGDTTLSNIRKFDVQDMIYKLQKETELSNNSIRTVFAIFNKSMKYAIDMELIYKSPAIGVQLPIAEKYVPSIISGKEMDELIKLTQGTTLELPVLLACRMGLRRGEILGLMWKDVDFNKKTLNINKTLSNINGFSVPKGRNATRCLQLPNDVCRALCSHQNSIGNNPFLVEGKGSMPRTPSWLSNRFAQFIEENGLTKIRFHDLRHSFSHNAHYNGMPVKQMSQILGHSSTAITLDYYVADVPTGV